MTYSISNEKYNVYPSGKRLKTEIWDAVKKSCGLPNSMFGFIGIPFFYEIDRCLNICLCKLKYDLKHTWSI